MADFEDRLRESLQARAADVTPDPALYRDVQSRIRRGRVLRWSLSGAGAVAMVALAALVVPSVLDRRIEFEPGPVATQPPSEEHSYDQAAAPCSDDGDALVAVVADAGDLPRALCSSGQDEEIVVPSDGGVVSEPALSPDGSLLAYVTGEDHPRVEIFNLRTGEPVETITNAAWPALAPSGALAWVRDAQADGQQPRLVVRQGEAEAEQPMGLPDAAEELTARHLVWGQGDVPRIVYWEAQYEGTTVWGDDIVEPGAWRFEPEPGANYAAPSSREDGRLHLLRTCCVEVEGDTADRVELGALTLPDTDATFEPIATLPEDLDPDGALSLVAAGTADLDPATGAWTSGAADAWLVGDGDQLYLVDEDGNTDLVADSEIIGAAFNAAADLPASPDAPASPGQAAQVDVHFVTPEGVCGEQGVVFARPVEGSGVLRGALEHLLAGPTPEEIAGGASPDTGFSEETAGYLRDVSIAENGVARIDFDARLAEAFVSTACMSGQLFAQLEPTVRQFPSVEEVVYSFDGSVEQFYTYYQSEVPPHRPGIPVEVTRMQQRIRDAVMMARQDDDWSALAELIDREDFSCSFSDQNEDCVALWQQQESEGQDPLGPLAEILRGQPAKVEGAPIWAWPTEFVEGDEYLGPRTGIQRDGTWRYYQQGGD